MKLSELEPLPPNEGPPLPIILDPYLPWHGYWPWYHKAVPVGPAKFTVKVVNLPEALGGWSPSFQDPLTGTFYQPTNSWKPGDPIPPDGNTHFPASTACPFSIPVSSGILIISAGGGYTEDSSGNITIDPGIEYKMSLNVISGTTYTFDFNTQKLI